MNEIMNLQGVYITAPATPGLFNTSMRLRLGPNSGIFWFNEPHYFISAMPV